MAALPPHEVEPVTLRRYLAHFRPHLPGVVAAAALLAVGAALPGAAILLLRAAIDDVLDPTRDQLAWLCLALATVGLLDGALALARTRLTKGIALAVTSELRRRLHERLLSLAPSQQEGTGRRLSTLTHDVDELQYGVSALLTAFRNPLVLVVLGVTAARVAPGLAGLALVLAPIVAGVAWAGGRALRRRSAERAEARAALADLAQEQLAGLRTVQAFAAEGQEHARFVVVEERDRRARLHLELDRLLPSTTVRAAAGAGVAALLWMGGRQVASGALEPGDLAAFALALGLTNRPLGGLGEVWSLLQRSLAGLEAVEAALATEPAVRSPDPAVAVPAGPLEVRWAGVVVDHGDGAVVRGVDLVAPPGGLLAIVGPTGAGKTTLLELVGRHVTPREGSVTVGGVDVRVLDLVALRRTVAVVRQETELFARTVSENVALGCVVGPEEVERALERAGAMPVVRALPGGLDTRLDEGGARLSGGERQRLALARALVRSPRVLLLDEATNQLDAALQRELVARIGALRGEVTVVWVTHDLGVAAAADRVAVLADGRIVEQGTPSELARAGGVFAGLAGMGAERAASEVGGP